MRISIPSPPHKFLQVLHPNSRICITLTVSGLNHTHYGHVLRILKEKCSLAKAMMLCCVARNTLRDFIGLCEMKILDKGKYKSIIEVEKGHTGQPLVKTIEMHCRAALSEYKAQSRRYKEEWKLLSFYPTDSFYSN